MKVNLHGTRNIEDMQQRSFSSLIPSLGAQFSLCTAQDWSKWSSNPFQLCLPTTEFPLAISWVCNCLGDKLFKTCLQKGLCSFHRAFLTNINNKKNVFKRHGNSLHNSLLLYCIIARYLFLSRLNRRMSGDDGFRIKAVMWSPSKLVHVRFEGSFRI